MAQIRETVEREYFHKTQSKKDFFFQIALLTNLSGKKHFWSLKKDVKTQTDYLIYKSLFLSKLLLKHSVPH